MIKKLLSSYLLFSSLIFLVFVQNYLPLTKKMRPLTNSHFIYTKMLKNIFGDDIYIFIHLPALYTNALSSYESLGKGRKILELILYRHTYCNYLFNEKIFSSASLQISRNQTLNN